MKRQIKQLIKLLFGELRPTINSWIPEFSTWEISFLINDITGFYWEYSRPLWIFFQNSIIESLPERTISVLLIKNTIFQHRQRIRILLIKAKSHPKSTRTVIKMEKLLKLLIFPMKVYYRLEKLRSDFANTEFLLTFSFL